MKFQWWHLTPLVLVPFFFAKKASVTATQMKLNPAQQRVADAVAAEAQRQGVDPRVALAYTEIESNFKNVTNGISYGPLQVNASFYAGPAEDLLGPVGVIEGVKKVKQYLAAAGGDPELGRVMYLCGIAGAKDPTKCSEVTKARVRAKWRLVAPKWGL